MSWQQDAACRGLTHLFYRDGGDRSYRQARVVCATCPVRAECAAAGMDESDGMWGGLTPRQRRGRGRQGAVCGTRPGYMRHLKVGLPPCEACRAANNAYQRDNRRRRAVA